MWSYSEVYLWPRLSQKGVISVVHPSLGERVASVENNIYSLRFVFFGVRIYFVENWVAKLV